MRSDVLVFAGAMVIAAVFWVVGIPSAIFWWAKRKRRSE